MQARLRLGDAKRAGHHGGAVPRRRWRRSAHRCPGCEHVLLVGATGPLRTCARWTSTRCSSAASDRFAIPPTDPEDMALLHFTSGTTGTPKGAIHVHEAVVAHHATGHFALDLHPDDVFWCTADPGLGDRHLLRHHRAAHPRRDQHRRRGATSTPSAGTASSQDQRVTRLVHRADRDPHADEGRRRAAPRATTCPALRFMASVGEPLNPEAVVWGARRSACPFHDNWWQTETGGIMIANFAAMDVRPGSMGRPLPGHRGGDRAGAPERLASRSIGEPGTRGRTGAASRLAVDVPRLPARGRALPQVLRRRLVPDRRSRRSATRTATSGSSAAPTT